MDLNRRRIIQGTALAFLAPSSFKAAQAQSGEGWHPLKGDDGKLIPNSRLPVELTSETSIYPA